MTRVFTHSLALFAAVLIATSTVGAIVSVPVEPAFAMNPPALA